MENASRFGRQGVEYWCCQSEGIVDERAAAGGVGVMDDMLR